MLTDNLIPLTPRVPVSNGDLRADRAAVRIKTHSLGKVSHTDLNSAA